jgi:hypothetical protein
MYKPLKVYKYLQWISRYGWRLKKGKIDWLLLDNSGKFMGTIKIQHPGSREVVAASVRKTEQLLKEKGLL